MDKKNKKNIFTKITTFLTLLIVVISSFVSFVPEASATVIPNGRVMYADTTNVGNLKHQNFVNGTWQTEVSTSVGSASNVRYVVAKKATTRNETASAIVKLDGTMDVLLFNATSSNAWTHQFTVSGVGPTSGTFTQPMDMFYEGLSGDLIVAYGKTAGGSSLFYRVWNGNSWTSEQSTTIPGAPGAVGWVNVATRNGTTTVSDMAAAVTISASSDDIAALRWNGSSWDNAVILTNASPTLETNRAGIAFEGKSGNILAVYTNVTANNAAPWKSNVFNGTSWSATTTLPNAGASTVGRWVSLASGPDDLIAFTAQSGDVTTQTTASTFDPYIWTGSASTSAWIKGTGDTSAGNMGQGGGDVAWETPMLDSNASPQAVFMSTQSTTALAKEYVTFTYDGGFSAVTTITGNNADDIQVIKTIGSKSSDDIMAVTHDIDSNLRAQVWNGSGANTISASLETAVPDGAANARTTWRPFNFTYDDYKPWMRNWRWLDNSAQTVGSLNPIAAENATSSVSDLTVYHLRVNLEEVGSSTQSSASKKLQYTDSATPDDPSTVWTDVGPQGSASIWRYANGVGTELSTIPFYLSPDSYFLSSSTALGVYLESGYASTTHATTTVTEYDYAIESNGTVANTDYSFRLYDNEFDRPVLRKQDSKTGGKCGTDGLSTCWYPAATPVANVTLTQLHYRWRNDDGSESGATYLYPEDNAVPATENVNLGTRKRLRFTISNTGSAAMTNYQFRIEQSSSSCSTWYSVPTSDTGGLQGWTMDLSGNIADLSSTTDSSGLSNPASKTFTAGYAMTSSNQTGNQSLTTTQFTELEYAIRPTASAQTGLLYCFRLTNAGDTTGFTYSSQPQITLSSFNRQGGGGEFESGGSGSIITGGNQSGGTGTESGGTGGSVPGGGAGGGGDVGILNLRNHFAHIFRNIFIYYDKRLYVFKWIR